VVCQPAALSGQLQKYQRRFRDEASDSIPNSNRESLRAKISLSYSNQPIARAKFINY